MSFWSQNAATITKDGPAPLSREAADGLELKVRLHQRLLDILNLSALDTIPREALRVDIRGAVINLLAEERRLLSPVQTDQLVDDILDEKNVFAFQGGLGIIHQSNGSARYGRVAVAGGNDEIYLQGTTNLPHEIAEKDEAPLQKAKNEQVAFRVRLADFPTELANARRDLIGAERDSLDRAPIEARIFNGWDAH